jgi:hypothetical protein
MYTYLCIYVYICIHIYGLDCIYVYMYIYIYIYIYTYIHIYIQTYIHIYTGAKKNDDEYDSDNNDPKSAHNKNGTKKNRKGVNYKEFSIHIEKLNASLATEPGQVYTYI